MNRDEYNSLVHQSIPVLADACPEDYTWQQMSEESARHTNLEDSALYLTDGGIPTETVSDEEMKEMLDNQDGEKVHHTESLKGSDFGYNPKEDDADVNATEVQGDL